LGSCVAMCLFDAVNRVGGMNHFLLATSTLAESDDLKYGINAIELLINRLLKSGAERCHLQAKLFGGARMTDHARDIGAGNAAFAKEFLEREGITCVSSSLGGEQARRVQFVPTTGAARQLQIAGMAVDETIRPRQVRTPQDITLF
ncbi:chemotaxis protein CheD, partial [Yoonia sp.]|uniref:chemotaxis protein CheD n=1 Tax=Yoonia sp. TaxID=2212373 RepID=UPI0025E4DBBB